MRKLSTLISTVLLIINNTVSGEQPFDLYDDLGVEYTRNLNRSQILGYYQVIEDKIYLLKPGSYRSEAQRNHTMLHELGHWARHESRLGPVGGCDCYPDYLEEVVVDIAAAVMADRLGIPRQCEHRIDDYIAQEISGHRVSDRNWQIIYREVMHTVNYVLPEYAVDRNELNSYFVTLEMCPK